MTQKIRVENLTYAYPFSNRNALENVSFSIERGECVGVIGRSGAGKSTLCLALTGLVPRFFKGKYSGKVLLDGEDVREIPPEKLVNKIGLVLQNPFSQISGARMTVYEEVAFGLENLGIPREEVIERVERVLKDLDLWEKRDENPFELSGGQLQRLAIASILVLQPEILILDEPTSQLDPAGTIEVFEVISEMKKHGTTIVLVEHKYELLVEYADRIIFLHEGRLIAFDEPEKIFSLSEIDDYMVGEPLHTKLCKKLNLKNSRGYYPVKFSEAVEILRGAFCGTGR
ncbi:cobalt ABC transporter ATP-binding protein [Fervidobacterium thailandense]|uniref:Cobalt ABC transporter ATP-binding protein n=1 Tax=Fervidobacterium thailandense TaxID=1008305 RepID=A0A1E3G3W5_9BACT|nr:cobalt ABC transporter ATP-binding protein [Fervidobacterium thailandense]